jgi:hypothetical protein
MVERADGEDQDARQGVEGGKHSYNSRVELSGIPFRITDTEEIIVLPSAARANAGGDSSGGTRWINELGEVTRS